MKNVMYWKPTNAETSKNTLIYLLWHKSEEAAKEYEEAWAANQEG